MSDLVGNPEDRFSRVLEFLERGKDVVRTWSSVDVT